ncbi:MAG TPA: proprotein convertase P-domain-containing protein [Polyangiaceae bacterium LLY-WYZ-15_(1-7)]|nr:proprotein convertase P-domain-containing protein [Polyangiaceae bacterium LLY-WYZ-15_(1-7)]
MRLAVEHSWRGDLEVRLEHAGRIVVLHDREGRSATDLDLDVETDRFAGTDGRGPWRLRVIDHAARDVGRVRAFALEAR